MPQPNRMMTDQTINRRLRVMLALAFAGTVMAASGCGGEPSSRQAAQAVTPAGSAQADAQEDAQAKGAAGGVSAEAGAAAGRDSSPEEPSADVNLVAARELALADHPFPRRVRMPEFPEDMEWINTAGPLRVRDLQGKFILLDFWTYCCINCIHVLPELKKLEKAYPNNLVVIGVHSAKFEAEKLRDNIEEAVLRYEIEHPVVNDADHRIWNMIGVRSWPTLLLIDPQGYVVWGQPGEVKFETIDDILKKGLPYYRKADALDETPLRFDLAAHRIEPTPLRFPGKVLADEAGGRLFITDSNHNRIVVTSLDGTLMELIGSGAIGASDGGYAEASFDHPQGLALHGDALYVADTENHMIRKVDLKNKRVATIAGVGSQAKYAPPVRWIGKPKSTAINSPWALWVHGDHLYIAMAGPHQIWRMTLDEKDIDPYAGNGQEDIVDGPLLPPKPYQAGYSSFAQPSGLTSDGTWLYVADSEGSSIRAVPFDKAQNVRTVVGTSELPFARLFTFGDIDGPREKARLQHALGVQYHEGKIYVADTYNNKIKVVDAESGETRTLAGTGERGASDEMGLFDEPAGIAYAGGTLYVADTNNHLIRTVDIETGAVKTLNIAGLTPPAPPQTEKKPALPGAARVRLGRQQVKPVDGGITLHVQLQLPPGWKINPLAPARYYVQPRGDEAVVDRASTGNFVALESPAAEFEINLPLAKLEGDEEITVGAPFYYCQDGAEGICKVGAVVWTVPLSIRQDAESTVVLLQHTVSR